MAIYRDQYGTLQRNDKHWSLEEELAGKQFPTQVGRALEELGIEVIVARFRKKTAPRKKKPVRIYQYAGHLAIGL